MNADGSTDFPKRAKSGNIIAPAPIADNCKKSFLFKVSPPVKFRYKKGY
jgi:hypothetical protein